MHCRHLNKALEEILAQEDFVVEEKQKALRDLFGRLLLRSVAPWATLIGCSASVGIVGELFGRWCWGTNGCFCG